MAFVEGFCTQTVHLGPGLYITVVFMSGHEDVLAQEFMFIPGDPSTWRPGGEHTSSVYALTGLA